VGNLKRGKQTRVKRKGRGGKKKKNHDKEGRGRVGKRERSDMTLNLQQQEKGDQRGKGDPRGKERALRGGKKKK